jgi:hypothetical protein
VPRFASFALSEREETTDHATVFHAARKQGNSFAGC